jgi:hypothetical protein
VTPFGSTDTPDATEEVAQLVPTLAEVDVDAKDNDDGSSSTKKGVAVAAIAVVVLGALTVGGIVIFIGYSALRPQP